MIRVTLHRKDGTEAGWINFSTLLVRDEACFRCSPPHILKLDQVKALGRKLCRLPQINSGTIGEFRWAVAD